MAKSPFLNYSSQWSILKGLKNKNTDRTPNKFMALQIKQLVSHFPTDPSLTRTHADTVNRRDTKKKKKKIVPSCKIETKTKKNQKVHINEGAQRKKKVPNILSHV